MDGDVRIASLAGLAQSGGNLPAVREESHLDEMRSAIRGDFERLAERRGEQELLRVVEDEPVSDAAPAPLDEPEETTLDEPEVEPRRSWLARLIAP